MSRRRLTWIGLLGLLAFAAAAAGDEASDAVEELFGEDMRRATATPGLDDDLKVAAELLAACDKAGKNAGLLKVLCRRAHGLAGQTPKGLALALEAMQLLRQRVPETAPQCDEEILSIRRRQYAAARGAKRKPAGKALVAALLNIAEREGAAKRRREALKLTRQAVEVAAKLRLDSLPALRAKVKILAALEGALRQIARLEARLADKPDDEQALARLIELYLVQLDSPRKAARFARETADETLRTYVPLAGRDVKGLAPQACLELAAWYRSLARKADPGAKKAMLVRARSYYGAFLEKHAKSGPARTEAVAARKAVEDELARLAPSAAAETQPATTRPADLTVETFDVLFGARIRQARSSAGFEDDLKVAGELLAVGKAIEKDTALLEAVCRNAYDLAAKTPKGLPLALEAMAILREHVPAKAPEWNRKALAVGRSQYAAARGKERGAAGEALVRAMEAVADDAEGAGDWAEAIKLAQQALGIATKLRLGWVPDLKDRVRELTVRDQIAGLKARLKADPDDARACGRLIALHVIDLDRPKEAVKFVTGSTDDTLRTYVPLAAEDVKDVAPQACLELAGWYRALAKQAGPGAKRAMLVRARGYYRAFLARHEEADLMRARAVAARKDVAAELRRLDPTAAGGPWTDVLKTVDPAANAHVGTWRRSGGRIGVASEALSRITIPVMPQGDYEVKVRFVRSAGDSGVGVILPVGGASVVLMLSSGGDAGGLSAIGGKMCDSNETRAVGKLANDKSHIVVAKVLVRKGKARVTATLNGKPFVQWEGARASLSAGDWKLPNPAALGLGAEAGSTVVFHTVALRMLTGKAAPAPAAADSG